MYAVYGTGGAGREAAALIHSAHQTLNSDPDIVFVDDNPQRPSQVNGLPVIGFQQLCSDEHHVREIIIAIGSGRVREAIDRKCTDAGLTVGSLVSPTARLLTEFPAGEGAVICDFVLVTADVRIGRCVRMDFTTYVAHDCVIGNYVTLSPRSSVNGAVHIEDHAFIGAHAVIRNGIPKKPLVIGKGAVVGMGAVVTKDVPAGVTVVGNPAQPLAKNCQGVKPHQ